MREYGGQKGGLSSGEKSGSRLGVPKTNETTSTMVYLMAELLRNKHMYYSAHMQAGITTTAAGMKEKLEKQMLDYEMAIKIDPENPFMEAKYKWHGKENDDILVSVMMMPYWRRVFETSGKYEEARRLIG